MDSKLARFCDGLMEAGWLTAVITIPLFFNVYSDRVFEPDKLTLLRSIALIMALAWVVKWIDLQGWRQMGRWRWRHTDSYWRTPFVLPTAALALVYIISTLFSVTPQVSWAGSYQRLQGTYTTFSYMVIFALAATTIQSRVQVRRIVTAVIMTSIPVAFYGLLQHFDLDPLPWGGDTVDRVAGHMGNAIFIAAYLIMTVPLTLSRILESFTNILNDEEVYSADVIRSSVYIFTLAIQLITIYWSGSRGPWLGLAVGLFAFVLVVLVSLRNAVDDRSRFGLADVGKGVGLLVGASAVLFVIVRGLITMLTSRGLAVSLAGPMGSFAAFVTAVFGTVIAIFIVMALRRGWRWLWLTWISLAVMLAGWLVLFNLPLDTATNFEKTPVIGPVVTTLDKWRTLPRIGRFGEILEAEGGTGRVRTLIWQGALKLVLPHEPLQFPDGRSDTFNFMRPIIGYGPESMYVAFNRFYPPELATLEARNASPDRSHNETFDALVITGLAGFLVWQWLYVSVFYFGFRYLGVLRSRRDGWLMVGLWTAGGVVTAVLFSLWRGTEYIGVAFPFGSIAGLVVYLIYYALFAPPAAEKTDPFQADRLLMVSLLAAVLAHYVEIHFGIAISATRLHFFVYLAMMLLVGHLLPQEEEAAPVVETGRSGRKRRNGRAASGSWSPVWISLFMVAVMVGTIGYTFINFVPPPDMTLQSVEDLAQITTGLIFRQSFFQNAKQGFIESPFLYLMLVLSWGLGVLLHITEMVKSGELAFEEGKRQTERWQTAAIMFVVMGVIAGGLRLFGAGRVSGATGQLGQSLLLIWAVLCLWVAVRLFFKFEMAALAAGLVALLGLVFALPVLAAGGVLGLAVALVCGVLLYLLWQQEWQGSFGKTAVLAAGSFLVGMAYIFLQASVLRWSITRVPGQIETIEQLIAFRVQEAVQTDIFLTLYYWFVVLVMVAGGAVLAWPLLKKTRKQGTAVGLAAAGLLTAAAIFLVTTTNLRVVQADMVFKRGKPFEEQAVQQQDAQSWDIAIAIYEKVREMAPREDFYYLFLGRAYLERSSLAQDTNEQLLLLRRAEDRLKQAQAINPLNTDHTANLARMNTRWAAVTNDEASRAERLALAEAYYQDALALSPQNSVIRTEYARLAFDLQHDCEKSIAIFDEAIQIDPFYAVLYFNRADILVSCAAETVDEAAQRAFYEKAVASLEAGFEYEKTNPRAWLQLGQLQQRLGHYEEAVAAFAEARTYNATSPQVPEWNLLFLEARLFAEMGDVDTAVAKAQQALSLAPAEVGPQIQEFIQSLVDTSGFDTSGERPLSALPPALRNNFYDAYPEMVIDVNGRYEAVIVTEKGDIRIKLLSEIAPLAVNNFVFLAEQGFYDGLTFHRVLDGFMAQGGDPTGSGTGGPGYEFANETSPDLVFDRAGLLAMANAGPDTNGSQFFITMAAAPWLDGGYTIFGEVIEGQDVVNALTRRNPEENPTFTGDVIQRIEIMRVDGQ